MSMRGCILLALVCLLGCHRGQAAADGENKEPDVRVGVKAAEKRTIADKVTGLGRCEAIPDRFAVLTAAAEGRVVRLLKQPGDAVERGCAVVELDGTIAGKNLKEKEAACDSQKASFEVLQSLPRAEEQNSAKLAIEQAQVAVEKARSSVDHLRPLRERGEISETVMYDAESALRQATLQWKTAQSQYEVLMLRPRPQAIAEAKTRIEVAQAAVDTAKAQVEQLTIRSPIAGVLNSLTCQLGQTLPVGTAVGEVVDSRRLTAVVWLGVADAQRVKAAEQTGPNLRLRCRRPDPLRDPGQGEGHRQGGRSADGQSPRAHPGRKRRRQADARPGRFGNDCRPRGKSSRRAGRSRPRSGRGNRSSASSATARPPSCTPKLGLKDEHWIEVGGTDLKPDESVVVEGGYNLPEGTEVAVEKVAEAEDGHDPGGKARRRTRLESRTKKPRREGRGERAMIAPGVSSSSSSPGPAKRGLNLVVLARPYFGLIVLATLFLAVFGLISMLRMPSGIYPEVAFPRITHRGANAGPGRDDRGSGRHAADRGGRGHGAGRPPGALEDGPRGLAGGHRFHARHATWCRP